MKERLERIENWEKLAVDAGFRPEDMAALCPISLRQLQRFFGAHFKQTPGQWARDLRCRLARQLIASGWSNRAVSTELGFGNESHLCHEFKRFYGVSPQTFSPYYGRTEPSASLPGSARPSQQGGSLARLFPSASPSALAERTHPDNYVAFQQSPGLAPGTRQAQARL